MKTLDEAITHCVEKAAELRKEADDCKEIYKEQCEKPNYKSYISNCLECSREHEQLAEWLKELKALKDRPQGDLISREALKKQFSGEEHYWALKIQAIIDNAPTVAVTDYDTGYQDGLEAGLNDIRTKGEWIKVVENLSWHYECNQCHNRPLMDRLVDEDVLSDFCPYCGADMRGTTNEP